MSLGDYIKRERLKRRLNLRRLALDAGVSHSYLSQVEANKFTPHPNWLKKIAKALNIDADILMGKAGFITAKQKGESWWEAGTVAEQLGGYTVKLPVGPRTVLPVIGYVPAKTLKEAFEASLGDTPYIEGSDFAVQVKGNSLIGAGILDRDICYIKKQSFAKNGDLVLALVNKQIVLRFFYKDDKTIRLEPANKKYEAIVSNAQIIGIKKAVLRY